jgi:hypothetical protein
MKYGAKMQVIKYYQAENQAHWQEEIGKGDWSAAELLHDWLESDKVKPFFVHHIKTHFPKSKTLLYRLPPKKKGQ